jgi:hypothetical protein
LPGAADRSMDTDDDPLPPTAPPPVSALSSFLSFFFGDDEVDGDPAAVKARSRMCCVLTPGATPLERVPSLIMDDDR